MIGTARSEPGRPAVIRLFATGPETILAARLLRPLAVLATLGFALLMWCGHADARLERAFGLAGAALALADTVADDSFFLPSAAQSGSQGGSLGDLFNRRGWVGGFAAGFLGSGFLGLAFGRGMVGELTSVASFLGLVFQLTLIAMLARLIWTWWRIDKAAGFGGLSPRQLADAYGRERHELLPDIESGTSTDAALDAALGQPKRKAK